MKLKPSAVRVLEVLVNGPAANSTLLQPWCGGNRFGARIAEIREAGVFVSCARVAPGRTQYSISSADLAVARELLLSVGECDL